MCKSYRIAEPRASDVRYSRSRMIRRRDLILTLPLSAVLYPACTRTPRPMTVGSKSSTEQAILGEIIAQHLERRLSRKIERRLNLGGTLIAYQALQNGEIALYPEYTGTIITEILREPPTNDAPLLFERARREMRRLAQCELFQPLGIDNGAVGVIRSADPRASKVSSLGDAAKTADGWKIAVSYEFQQKPDAIPALTQYRLPMVAPIRAVDSSALLRVIEQGQVDMAIANATDGALEAPSWKVLPDDRQFFTPQQLCILASQRALDAEPKLRTALAELSGKFTNDSMRHMNAQAENGSLTPAQLATGFLTGAGLA
jgi:osmoprotectant transport system substrate-binding protein